MRKTKKIRKNMKKQICSITLSSMMLLTTGGAVYAVPVSKLPSISDNSLVIGKHLFELDKVNSSQYNLNTFVKASQTVDENNGVYYKYNGKWYTGRDIENFNDLKNAKGLDTINNEITKVNGEDPKSDFILDWYQDGDYTHDVDGKDESIEQFVVYFNKPVKLGKGNLKIIVPDNSKKDSYGKDKFGVIECSTDGKSQAKALQNIEGGAPVTCFVIHDKGKDKDIPEGFTDRFIIELTEDWTRILNTEKTGLKYENIKGLRLVAENFEDEQGNKVASSNGIGMITAKRDINLAKDNEKPYVVKHKVIYSKIGENGNQEAGKTRILFNEPVQLLTNDILKDLEKSGLKQPCIVGSYSKGKYMQYNPITPSQEQLKSLDKGIPVFEAEYRKVDEKGQPILNKQGNAEIIKGIYGLCGDVFEKNDAIEDNGDKIKLRLNEIDFKYDFDSNNKGITRFRDYGTIMINPEKPLPEGNWQLVVRNFTDDAGNKMDEYISETFQIEKYFDVVELNKDKVKIKFTKPFTKNDLWGNKIPVVVSDSTKKPLAVTWVEDIKEGQLEAEATFKKTISKLEGTVYVNTMEYNVQAQPQKPEEEKLVLKWYEDGDYKQDKDGENESPEQFFVMFNKPVKDMKFKIIVPNKANKDPYGEGKLMVLEENKDFVVSADPCKEDGWKEGQFASKYIIELTKDWTKILNTKATGMHYYDENFRDICLVAENVEVKGEEIKKEEVKVSNPDSQNNVYKDGKYEGQAEGFKGTIKVSVTIENGKMKNVDIIEQNDTPRFFNKAKDIVGKILNKQSNDIETVSGATYSSQGIKDAVGNALEKAKGAQTQEGENNNKGDNETKGDTVIAENYVTLAEDTQKPRIVYQFDGLSMKNQTNIPVGFLGFAFNEPVQVNDPNAEKDDEHGENPLTPSEDQGDKVPEANIKYVKIEDENGQKVKENIEVKGKCQPAGCMWKKMIQGKNVGDEFLYDVYPFDESNRIKCTRDFGWYGVEPMGELTSGKWKIVINSISDEVGNVMDEYSVNIDVK